MDYEKIEKLNTVELKNYIKINGFKVSGSKKKVIAKVFNAYEMM